MEKCKRCGRYVKDTKIRGTEDKDTHCEYCEMEEVKSNEKYIIRESKN